MATQAEFDKWLQAGLAKFAGTRFGASDDGGLTLSEALGKYAKDPRAVNLSRVQAKLDQVLAAVGRVDDQVIAGLSSALAPALAAAVSAQVDVDEAALAEAIAPEVLRVIGEAFTAASPGN